jgi:hypothetical protein
MLAAAVMLGGLLALRYPAKYQIKGDRDPFLVQSTSDTEDNEPNQPPLKTGKTIRFLHGVPRDWRMIIDPPMLLGRWVAESVVGPTVALFNARSPTLRILAYATGLATAILFILGVIWWWRRGGYWAIVPLLYLIPILLQWGARTKPRYLAPLSPMLILILAGGVIAILNCWKRSPAQKNAQGTRPLGSKIQPISTALAIAVIVGNLPAWSIEAYIRRQSTWDFYDVARRGAAADLVDIAAHLQKHAGEGDTIWFNRGAERRVAHFLAGRRILVRDTPIQNWDDAAEITAYVEAIPTADRWAILYVDQPAKNYTWPRWHWPIKPSPNRPRFYRLMQREQGDTWTQVTVRADRSFVRAIPQSTR